MSVLVDTCIWSDALRKKTKGELPEIRRLNKLIEEGRVAIIGPIRQEILSGIKHEKQFEKLKSFLRSFPDLLISLRDYEAAAKLFNHCRSRGIQGSSTDFLICAIAASRKIPIFTTDKDFNLYLPYGQFQLYEEQSHES